MLPCQRIGDRPVRNPERNPLIRLFTVVLTVAIACVIPSAASAEPASASTGKAGLAILSAKVGKSAKNVQVKVRWHGGIRTAAGNNKRFVVRVLAHGARGRKANLGEVRRKAARSGTELISVKTNPRRLKAAKRVTVTATQQYDRPTDADRLFERNAFAIKAVAGKAQGVNLRPCAESMVVPNAELSDCNLYGAHLANSDLSGVILRRADLEQGSLAGANLRTTDLTSANLIGTDLMNARWPETEQTALTFPRDGQKIVDLIATAETSVDVVIYDFGGPNLVGQPSQPGALMKAVQNGVNVRVILNSSQRCVDLSDDEQSKCAGQSALDPLYATQSALEWASSNPAPGKTAGKYRVQFSSENYQVTHQKSILIDTSNPDGSPRTAAEMTPNSKILVSTGNLQAFPVDWGRYSNCTQWTNGVCTGTWEVINADYLTNPAATCKGGEVANCLPEWGARDFAIEVTDYALMERIAAVFAADQTCLKWDEAPIYGELLGSELPDTWANGTLLLDGSGYPEMSDKNPAFYGGNPDPEDAQGNPLPPEGPNPALQSQPQGNSRARQVSLMDSAQESLIVYNEEMADPDMANALVRAKQRGVDVRVVMAASFQKSGIPYQDKYFDFLTANGVKVNLLPKAATQGVDYIHAKAIVADGTNAFMGSENFGYASLNFNRELGLMITNTKGPESEWLPSVQGVAAIMTAFEKDWDNPKAFSYEPQQTSPPYPYPPLVPGQSFGTANMRCIAPTAGGVYEPELPLRTTPVG